METPNTLGGGNLSEEDKEKYRTLYKQSVTLAKDGKVKEGIEAAEQALKIWNSEKARDNLAKMRVSMMIIFLKLLHIF